MKSTMGTSKMGFFKAAGNVAGSRYFRAVALGTLLVGAAALYITVNQGEGATPSAGSEIGQAYQEPTYPGPFDYEAEERVYDEIREAFIGIPAPSSQTAEPFQAPAPEFRIDPEWERAIERRELIRDYEAMGIPWAYDEFGNVVELPGKAVTDTPSAGQLPGEGSPAWFPDTPYYLDPDWREGQAPDYLVALDEAMELAYDELSRDFFGVPFVAGKEEATMIFEETVLPGRYKEGSATEIFDEGVLPGRYKEKATPSIDQRFPPGTLPED